MTASLTLLPTDTESNANSVRAEWRVYLARDLRHERQVALKVLRPEIASAVGADRFLAEIRTTANLQHPHLLPLFDSGRVTGAAGAF